MKKIVSLFLIFIPMLLSAAQYYVAGDGRTGNPWCDGKSWVATGSPMTMNAAGTAGTITFSAVPVGAYQFKVTNGTTWYGAGKLDKTNSNLYTTGSDNICFSLQAAQDVTITYDGSKITINGSIGNDHPDPSQYGKYGVPAKYEGVMLQGFYWNSYGQKTNYGRMKYIDWLNNGWASEVGETFDLVWFPPSGNGGGTGYYTKTYSNLDSDWGSKAKLLEVLDTLHAHGCKALADVVVNHRAANSGWARSFTSENFGTYGTFQITSQHICSTDEAKTDASSDSKSLTYGAADTGNNDGGCRDLDHTSTYVQNYIKAYVQWLLDPAYVGFDGFRYDMVIGYGGQYLSMYNQASNPFFSVAEYWEGIDAIKTYLESASYNTTCFDFPTKYLINEWGGGSNYSKLKNPGMRKAGLRKNAVTFIDNHDTFERSDNQSGEFLGYNVDLSTKRQQILQANAYLLMLPGIPCVFWPHWYTFKNDIKQMIAIRKRVGIHSESSVSSEVATTNSYSATVIGNRGQAILRMGSARDTTLPNGYTLEYSGPQMEIYVKLKATAVENISTPARKVEKRIENGQLVIVVDGVRYNAAGVKL